MTKLLAFLFTLSVCLLASGCAPQGTTSTNSNVNITAAPSATSSPSPTSTINPDTNSGSLTLPVLDAFFADESFSELLKTRLPLSDEQIVKLKALAHEGTAKLNEANVGNAAGESVAARAEAKEKISALIGEEKTNQLEVLVRERWSDTGENTSDKTPSGTTNPNTPGEFAASAPNRVPTDSRVVVNAPAYRMDVFDGGRLVKSYKIGIGYPQFPLPAGLRKARTIIFNPTWTPPDEPWVAKMKNVSAGEKVEAGSKLNPLGPIKIPIGGPSLIHGGKSPAKLGTFASHGCVGLTTPQIQDFAKLLAQIGGSHLTDMELAKYARDKTETKQQKLQTPVAVELRYETIVVEDGALHIYRDVYDQDTNTEANLRAVLQAHGVQLDNLTDDERAQALDALAKMAGKSTVSNRPTRIEATPDQSSRNASDVKSSSAKKATKKPSRNTGNQKEIVIEIAALKGKGYPAPVALDSGSGATKVTSTAARKRT